ncbi:MAG: UDP-N-acetylmuramate--L-alanine ligase [Gammaproteobacteria bacterium]
MIRPMDESTRHDPMSRIRRVHFIGCGGVGMGGIAEVLINLGYEVSGSDRADNAMTRRLTELGAVIRQGHDPAIIETADVVVISSAIPDDNPEVVAAREQRIPVIRRAEMLAEIMRFRFGIAIAGTHGKTTTTSLVASLLTDGGLDPTFVIGGRLNSAATNAKLGAGQYLVAEADESDASFLHLQPVISVITNIDADHLGTYEGDFDRLRHTFIEFIHNLPFYGLAVLCIDDEEVRAIMPELGRPMLTYGLSEDADVRASALRPDGVGTRFEAHLPGRDESITIRLNLPGTHNVLNALAAIAIAHELGVEDSVLQSALDGFEGIGRRFQPNGTIEHPDGDITFIDDYGHHPREVAATLAAAREVWPDRRIVMCFQPHRYTRTRDLFDDFTEVLASTDLLLLCEVYAAGEQPISGADGRALSRAVRARGTVNPVFVADVTKLDEALLPLLEAGDVVMTLGAGNIGAVAQTLAGKCGQALGIPSLEKEA